MVIQHQPSPVSRPCIRLSKAFEFLLNNLLVKIDPYSLFYGLILSFPMLLITLDRRFRAFGENIGPRLNHTFQTLRTYYEYSSTTSRVGSDASVGHPLLKSLVM